MSHSRFLLSRAPTSAFDVRRWAFGVFLFLITVLYPLSSAFAYVPKDSATIDAFVAAGYPGLTSARCQQIGATVKACPPANYDSVHDTIANDGVAAEAEFNALLWNGSGPGPMPVTSKYRWDLIDYGGKPTQQGTTNDIYISYRIDGIAGTGTKDDPFDGSTAGKFDTLIKSYSDAGITNLRIHLVGSGPFQTNVGTSTGCAWFTKSGWDIGGAGRDVTTVQLIGSAAGHDFGLEAFKTDAAVSTDHVHIHDLTVDCNPGVLIPTGDTVTVRTLTGGVTSSGSPTVTSATGAFTSVDLGRSLSNANIPANTFIGVINSTTSIGLSSSPVANVPVNATGSATAQSLVIGEKNFKTSGIAIFGSYTVIDNVRVTGAFGSLFNSQERFAIAISNPTGGAGQRNEIRNCRVDSPAGNYGSPYALFGDSATNPMRDSKVFDCWAFGNNDGAAASNDFNTGGVNCAYTDHCEISSNHFTDCQGAFYSDTGTQTHLRILNNTVVRGWGGIMLVADGPSHTWTKSEIEIAGNNIGLQNRPSAAAAIGINVINAATTRLSIKNNTISYQEDGSGLAQYTPLQVQGANYAAIAHNLVPEPSDFSSSVNNVLSGNTNTRLTWNRTLKGNLFASLMDTEPAVTRWRVTKVADGGSGSMIFSGTDIPAAGYNDLRVTFNARSTASANLVNASIAFNDDSGSDYAYHILQTVGSSATPSVEASSSSATALGFCNVVAATGTTNQGTGVVLNIPNYASTSLNKNVSGTAAFYYGTTPAQVLQHFVGTWLKATPAAITKIYLAVDAGNFTSGSTFTLEAQ